MIKPLDIISYVLVLFILLILLMYWYEQVPANVTITRIHRRVVTPLLIAKGGKSCIIATGGGLNNNIQPRGQNIAKGRITRRSHVIWVCRT